MKVPVCIVMGLVLSTTACSSDTVEPFALDDPAEFVSETFDTEQGELASTEAGDAADPVQATSNPAEIRGAVIDRYSLAVGDCFNRAENLAVGRTLVVTSLINCNEPHDHQIYHRFDYPAPHPSIHPGDEVMQEFAVQSCYRQFAQWVGNEYETSALDIGVITPSQENFEDDNARYRTIHCWVEDYDGEPLVGDTHQSGW